MVAISISVLGQNSQDKVVPTFMDIENSIPKFDDLISGYFQVVLKASNGEINGFRGAAVLTGIPPNTLRNKMKKLKIPFGRKS